MDRGYDAFCLGDRLFYDSPTLVRDPEHDFGLAKRPVPAGWTRGEFEDWVVYTPLDVNIPSQGWKVHVSASLGDAEKILSGVWDYCVANRLAFKFVRSLDLLLLANGKYADRGSSGKFVTIYPVGEAAFETAVTDLGLVLDGFDGPYILSDLRWGEGPVYVRYGGFAERYCLSEQGQQVAAIERPDGTLVPDIRSAAFTPPAWITVPAFLTPALESRRATGLGELPYQVHRAMHFSNGGGVYAATDQRTGEAVVLKEARPFAGLAIDGSDAVTRLENEQRTLEALQDLGITPRIRDTFVVGGHHFIVEDFVEAIPLAKTMVDWYPLANFTDDADATDHTGDAAYVEWAMAMASQLEHVVSRVHERGFVIGDLHPHNVMVRDDDQIVLVDLEVARPVADATRPSLADPGFAAPHGVSGFAIDDYAVACTRLSLFLPLTELIQLSPHKAVQFGHEIQTRFDVPTGFIDDAVSVILRAHGVEPQFAPEPQTDSLRVSSHPADWADLRAALTAAIRASATPERDDRLFPGDVAQFDEGGLGLAYGAAGVLWALHESGAGTFPDWEDWLIRHALEPTPGVRFGLYDGLFGVAFALESLGRSTEARQLLQLARSELRDSWYDLGIDLHSGSSGIALTLAWFAERTGDADLLRAALEMAEVIGAEIQDLATDEADRADLLSGSVGGYAGLTRGAAGPALLFIRLYEQTKNPLLLDLARTALGLDITRCVQRDDGSYEVNEGYRTMPYLHDGSIGIGLVIDAYLAHRDDPELSAVLAGTRIAALGEFYIEPCLYSGRAGMIAFLAHLSRSSNRRTGVAESVNSVAAVAAHIERLAWHAIPYAGGLAFPGDQLLRLSMDLATGTAGVLLALASALHEQPVTLPFFGSPAGDAIGRTAQGGE